MSHVIAKPSLAVVTTMLLLGLPSIGAHAASDAVCRDYATAAVRQVHLMHERPACDRGIGTRWAEDWNVHYQWCRDASYEAIGAERDARPNWLRACSGR